MKRACCRRPQTSRWRRPRSRPRGPRSRSPAARTAPRRGKRDERRVGDGRRASADWGKRPVVAQNFWPSNMAVAGWRPSWHDAPMSRTATRRAGCRRARRRCRVGGVGLAGGESAAAGACPRVPGQPLRGHRRAPWLRGHRRALRRRRASGGRRTLGGAEGQAPRLALMGFVGRG